MESGAGTPSGRGAHHVNLEQVGLRSARCGLILCLLFIGLAKFTSEEAHGIQPLVARSPLMAWMYCVSSVRSRSNVIGPLSSC